MLKLVDFNIIITVYENIGGVLLMKNYEGQNYAEVTNNGDRLVLIDFFATWCQPCKILMPIVEELALERDDVDFYKIDVDQHHEVAIGEKVSSIPTLVLYRKGERLDSLTGVRTKQQLLEWLEQHK